MLLNQFSFQNQHFILKLSESFYDHYHITFVSQLIEDSMPTRYARELAINIACRAGNEKCWEMARNYGLLDTSEVERIARGLDQPVLCNFFKQSDSESAFKAVYNRMIKMYQPMDESYKSALLNSLACTKDPEFLYEFLVSSLGSATNNVNLTLSERRSIFNAALRNENGMNAAFRLIESFQSSEITSSYGWSWQRVLTNIANSIFSEAEQFMFLEKINALSHPMIVQGDRNAAIQASANNLNDQKLSKNMKQMEKIVMLLEREFDVTTITPPLTTSSSSSSTVSSTTPLSSSSSSSITTTTEASSDTPTTQSTTTTTAKATTVSASIIIFILTLTLLKF